MQNITSIPIGKTETSQTISNSIGEKDKGGTFFKLKSDMGYGIDE